MLRFSLRLRNCTASPNANAAGQMGGFASYQYLERPSKDYLLRQLAQIRKGVPCKPREQHPVEE
jgi:hypothetical protein